jgi:putative transposase
MMYPLVRELAARDAPSRVPVAVSCRVLNFSRQAYYQWAANPVPARDWEEAHLINAGNGPVASERRIWRLCSENGILSVIHRRRRSGLKDLHSNRIVGYSMDGRMKAYLTVAGLNHAVALRKPAGTVVHSDRGSENPSSSDPGSSSWP